MLSKRAARRYIQHDTFSYRQTWPFYGHPSEGCIRRRRSHQMQCLPSFDHSTSSSSVLCNKHLRSSVPPTPNAQAFSWSLTMYRSNFKMQQRKRRGAQRRSRQDFWLQKPSSRIWMRECRATRARTTCSREKQAKRGPECRNCPVGCRWCSESNIWWSNDILQEGWPPSPCTVPRHFW